MTRLELKRIVSNTQVDMATLPDNMEVTVKVNWGGCQFSQFNVDDFCIEEASNGERFFTLIASAVE